MKKLDEPNYEPIELYDEAVAGIGNANLKKLYSDNRAHIIAANDTFEQESQNKNWCALPRALHGNTDAVITGSLTKKNLTSLYGDHVVGSSGEARKIYDKILVKAKKRCPYCGGIGEVKTLDHYLPKAYFPSYSVLPNNLVPSCRDCNSGMGGAFSDRPELQVLHPYLDDPHFFNEKWIKGTVLRTFPIVVVFEVLAPAYWSPTDKSRVTEHFKSCDLANRYSLQVPEELSPLIIQRRSTMRVFNEEQFRQHLLCVANDGNLLLNGWKRTLFAALAETDWFCSADFTHMNGHMP